MEYGTLSHASKRSGKYLQPSQQIAIAPAPEMAAYSILRLISAGRLKNDPTRNEVMAQARPPEANKRISRVVILVSKNRKPRVLGGVFLALQKIRVTLFHSI